MTINQKKQQLINEIKAYNKAQADWHVKGCPEGFEPQPGVILELEDFIEKLELAKSMLPEEIARIKRIPVYQDDWREVKDIKEKYGFSWNQLKMIASLEWER